MDDKRFRSDRERDPIAELARLVAQADTQEESAPSDNRLRQETVSVDYEETPELPPAPELTVDLNEHEQACERDGQCAYYEAYDVDDRLYAGGEEYQGGEVPHYAAEEEHQDHEVPRARRHSLTLAIAIFGLALAGTACAVDYRNMFGGSVWPTITQSFKAINERNTIPSASDPQAASSGHVRSVQRPLARSTTWSRVKTNQPRSGPQKPPRALRCPGQAPPRRRAPVRLRRNKRCRAQR